MKRVLVLALIVALASGLFAGGGASRPAEGSINLTFVGYSPTLEVVHPEVAAGFQKMHPNVNLNLVEKDGSQYLTILMTMIQSGEPLDGFLLNHNNMMAQADIGNLVPLQSHFDHTQYPFWYVDYYAYKGNVYSIPGMCMDTVGVYYNKKIFQANGINYPRTQADNEAIMQTLVSKGIQPIVVPGRAGDRVLRLLNSIVAAYEPSWNDEWPFQASLQDPRFIRCLNIFTSWRDKGFFGADYTENDNNAAMMKFMQGEAAMFIDISGNARTFAANPDIGVMFFKRADGKDAGMTSPAQHTARGVYAKSSDVPMAIEFVKYFATEGPQKLVLEATGITPITNAPYTRNIKWDVPPLYMAFANADNQILTFQNRRGWAFKDDGPSFINGFYDLMLQLLHGSITPEAMVKEADQWLDYSKADYNKHIWWK